MTGRELKVGVVGTFDVENYGDLLFPLIARRELADRLGNVELIAFSYRAKAAAEWPFAVTPVSELPRLAPSLDGMLIGGGFLARFDKHVAEGYLPPSAEIHHPTGFWLTPALICLQHGVPLLWNAPGANYDDIPAWAAPLLELALAGSSYIALRDERSRQALEPFAGGNPISVVPDTVFGLSRWLPERPTFEFNRLRDANGIGGPYILIQGVRGLEECYRFLELNADRLRGYRFLVVPIGPVNGDADTLSCAGVPGLVRLPIWPHPFLLAELIRNAEAVIGPSFHLAITALTSGVPVFSPANLNLGKFSGLADFDGIHPLPTAAGHDAEWFVSRLGRTARSPRIADAMAQVTAHWDHVAETLRAGRTDNALAVGRFWQSLPGILEAQATTGAAAVASLASWTQTTRRIAELKRLIALARKEISARDSRIAQLLQSTSWKITAPMRFVGRRLGR